MNKIGVVTPTFNRHRFLANSLRCVLDQQVDAARLQAEGRA